MATNPPITRRARRAREVARLRRRNFAAFLGITVLLTPILIASVWVFASVRHNGSNDIIIEVEQGWGAQQVGDMLQKDGVIKSSSEFQQVSAAAGVTAFPAGRYVFTPGFTAQGALDTLRGGPAAEIPDIPLLLPPGLTIKAIADRVGRLPGKDAQRFLQVAESGVVRSKYEPDGVTSLEGLTWPDTYLVGANETEDQILQKIVSEFDKRADAAGLGNPSATGLSPYQLLTAASLVQAESGNDSDSPLIAAVIVNRLRDDMPLQVDATLCYAKGGCPPVPTEADKKIDSPFNTYKVAGLPPTPIETVSAKTLAAALAPANVTYKYYVSDKNGKTYFATTQAEHERNVRTARNAD
ncbi:MAG TPA: endolytic transglycosylase MltG [Acidimicrobiia bacterium]